MGKTFKIFLNYPPTCTLYKHRFQLIHACSAGNWLKHGIRGQPKVIIPFHQKNQDLLLAKILGMPSGIKNKGVGSTRRKLVAVTNENEHRSKIILFSVCPTIIIPHHLKACFKPDYLIHIAHTYKLRNLQLV